MEKTPVEVHHLEEGVTDATTEKPLVPETAYVAESPESTTKSAAEKRLLLKCDLVIVPLCCLIYFSAYLDRNSTGLANVMGLSKDLHLTADQYYNCLMMFFIGYIVFMWPGNVFLRLIPPHFMIGGAALLYGLFLVAMSAAQGYATALSMRVLIGASQSFIQGMGLFITMWYKRDEIATRSALYYGAATISGAFSGLIAYGVQRDLTKQITGKEPWRWLFITEGSMAMAVGALVILFLPKLPEQLRGKKHWLLRPDEIEIATARMKTYNTVGAKINLKQLLNVAKDPKCWLFASINAGIALAIGSVGIFLPTFIKAFGYSQEKTLLLSVIPYAIAGLLLPPACIYSDRLNRKGPFLITTLTISSTGYIILITVSNTKVKIFATCLITPGVYCSAIFLLVWLGINTGGFTKRGTTWAMAEITGQCFAIMGTRIYDGPPRYIKGHAIVLGFLVYSILASVTLLVMMRQENHRRDRIEREYRDRGDVHAHALMSLEDVQDGHVAFRYIL